MPRTVEHVTPRRHGAGPRLGYPAAVPSKTEKMELQIAGRTGVALTQAEHLRLARNRP
jgi:hypothetical protein